MTPNAGQTRAIEMARALKKYDKKPKVGVLAGCAGTGKTTTLKFIAEDLGFPICVCPTGKAAVRITQATALPARTIHSWMYSASEDIDTGEVDYTRKPPDQLETSGELPIIIVDEASMVGLDLWDDLYDACACARQNILVVGDPFQLPPVVNSSEGQSAEFSLLSKRFACDARVELTEVLRQALDSPVLRAATLVRQGKFIEAIMGLPRCKPAEFCDLAADVTRRGGIAICHKNSTRLTVNAKVRRALGRVEGEVCSGEPLLILQNSLRVGLFNGETPLFGGWTDPPAGDHAIKDWIRKKDASSKFGVGRVGDKEAVLSVAQVFGLLEELHKAPIHKVARIIYGEEEYDNVTGQTVIGGPPFLHANFGYCLTGHKSQGSEWSEVVVAIEPSVRTKNEDGLRFAYTCFTRASEDLTVCLGTPT